MTMPELERWMALEIAGRYENALWNDLTYHLSTEVGQIRLGKLSRSISTGAPKINIQRA
jgi:hypothetical protein